MARPSVGQVPVGRQRRAAEINERAWGGWFGRKSAPADVRPFVPTWLNRAIEEEGFARSYEAQVDEVYRRNPVGQRSVRLLSLRGVGVRRIARLKSHDRRHPGRRAAGRIDRIGFRRHHDRQRSAERDRSDPRCHARARTHRIMTSSRTCQFAATCFVAASSHP